MVIVELLIDIQVYQGLILKKKNEFVMSGAVMRQLMKLYPGGVNKTRNFEDIYRKLSLENLKEGEEVFLFRSGGIGDVMFILPLIKYLKKNYKVKIKMGTSPMYSSILENNPYIDTVVQMPFKVKELESSDHHLMFEGVIEDTPAKAQILHAVDLFLEEGGVNFKEISSEEKIPYLYLKNSETKKIEKEIKELRIDHAAKKIGFQIESSSPIRTFPLDKMIVVMKKLIEKGYVAFVFGGKRQERTGEYLREIFLEEKNFVNLITGDRSLRDSIVYTSQMDIFIAPDSSFIHIAGGLGVSVVGLYGCFPSLLRMRYYKNAIGIDCGVGCAPSFIHGHSPCSKGFPSPCFSVISVDDILNAVNHLLGKKKVQLMYPTFNEFKKGELIKSPFSTLSISEKEKSKEEDV